MTPIRLVHHVPGLHWLGLGPDLRPCRALLKLRRLLAGSDDLVNLWRSKRLVDFQDANPQQLMVLRR